MGDSELAELRKQCITSLSLCADNVSKYFKTGKDKQFRKLRKYAKQYCVLQAQEEFHLQALEKAKSETDASNIDTLEERYNNHLSSLVEERLNADRHPYMLELNAKIETSLLKARDLAMAEDHEASSKRKTKKTKTKTQTLDPVQNTVCGHIYDQKSILKKRTKCPVAGCSNRVPITPK